MAATRPARPLPDDPAQRLQARHLAAVLAAEAADAVEQGLSDQAEALYRQHRVLEERERQARDRAGNAWAAVRAYRHSMELPTATDDDHDEVLLPAEHERVLRLLADAVWVADGGWVSQDAAAQVNGIRLRYDGYLLRVLADCPRRDGASHITTVLSRVQLLWALDHLDQPDDPRWVCDAGCVPVDVDEPNPAAATAASQQEREPDA